MSAFHLVVLLLVFNHEATNADVEFPTIDKAELIAHELINPFTPYFRDSKYRDKRGMYFYTVSSCLVFIVFPPLC